jgi:arginyl-tRNA--protein-N-Asp/Glu arginylyltransferase
MSTLSELRFFTTPEHDCSYLDDRKAITLFVDPLAKVTTDIYSSLSAVGFRRSGTHIYRPYCQSCTACIPARVPMSSFHLRRRHTRILKKNKDVIATQVIHLNSDEYFNLYQKYIDSRHQDGDMYPADQEQFESFLVDGRKEAIFVEFRANEKLLAIAVMDKLDNGLSAIYTFFDPEESSRSLGSYAILWLIEEAKRLSLEHVYLGYWIKQSQKMNYKLEFKPIELYVNSSWVVLADG